MNEHALSECSTRAEAALDGLGVRWALIGALAAIRYRVDTRATTDVDYLVERHDRLPTALTDAGFDVTVQRDDAGTPYFVRARLGGTAAEFLIAETEYQAVALDRAVDHVITPEDVVVHKLIAWRSAIGTTSARCSPTPISLSTPTTSTTGRHAGKSPTGGARSAMADVVRTTA